MLLNGLHLKVSVRIHWRVVLSDTYTHKCLHWHQWNELVCKICHSGSLNRSNRLIRDEPGRCRTDQWWSQDMMVRFVPDLVPTCFNIMRTRATIITQDWGGSGLRSQAPLMLSTDCKTQGMMGNAWLSPDLTADRFTVDVALWHHTETSHFCWIGEILRVFVWFLKVRYVIISHLLKLGAAYHQLTANNYIILMTYTTVSLVSSAGSQSASFPPLDRWKKGVWGQGLAS